MTINREMKYAIRKFKQNIQVLQVTNNLKT